MADGQHGPEVARRVLLNRETLVLSLLSVASWMVGIAGHYFYLWLDYGYMSFGFYIFLVIWSPLATIFTLIWVVVTWRRHGPASAAPIIAVGLMVAVILVAVPWARVFPQTWFAVNRAEFTALARMADHGQLQVEPMVEGLDSVRLPSHFRSLTLGHSQAWDERQPDRKQQRVLFLPLMDKETVGFAYVYGGPCTGTSSCAQPNDDDLPSSYRPGIQLGHGWWWVR